MPPDVFGALANPIRRDLLGLLREGPKPVKVLAAGFEVGRPAISEHLKVLVDAGLVTEEPRGRERYYHLQAAPLREVGAWLGAYERFWKSKLHDLSTLLDDTLPDEEPAGSRPHVHPRHRRLGRDAV
jgi:DNA-binding transcriptional ArsR family regulator